MSRRKKHILVISQYFYPEQFRINDICTEWVKRGYKVTVVTGIPNYPQGIFFEGYGLTKKRKEYWNGIDIVRIPLIARGHGAIGLISNYLSFVVSGFFWNLTTKIRADYVFTFEVSPMTQALLGVWYSKKHKIPNYLYVQDLWPDNVEIVTGIHNKVIIGVIDWMVRKIYRNSDKIFGTSPSFVREIQKKCDDKNKVFYWPQYAESFYKPVNHIQAQKLVPEIPDDDRFKIVFTGNIGRAQGLEILPRVAKQLKDENVCFVIIGDGRYKECFISEVKKRKVDDKFIMIGRQPAERIPLMLGCCDAAFLSFMNNELFAKTIPAKLQSYMACGIPIVASAVGETERIISEAQCGVCSRIGCVKELSDNIQKLINMPPQDRKTMGENAIAYSEKWFYQKHLLDEMDSNFISER